MNKQLIERLRNGEAAILNPDEFSHENLNRVLANAINNGINEMASGVMRYYWFDNGILICSDYAPTHITAAPLSQFFEEEKQPETNKMKPYIEYLAEEIGHTPLKIAHINGFSPIGSAQAAADKFAEDRMAAFAIWCSENQWEITIDGIIWVKVIKLKPVFKTTSELIAIFNSETNGR